MNSYLLSLRNSSEPSKGEEEIIMKSASAAELSEKNSETLYSPKEFFNKVSDLIVEKELLILAVDTFSYMKTRRIFLSGLSLEMEVSDEILGLTPENYYLRELHASIPKGATALPTKDGLYSGFIFKRETCAVAFIPLDEEKTEETMGKAFKGYIEKLLGETAANKEPEKSEPLPTQPDAVAAEPSPVSAEAPAENQKDEHEAELSAAVAEAQEALNKAGITAAVSLTPSAEKILGDCGSQGSLVFLPRELKRDGVSPKNYAALLAKEAAEKSGTSLGASVTNAFKADSDTSKNIFIYAAVADSEAATVRKIYAEPGESLAELIGCALKTVLEMVKTQAEGQNLIPAVSENDGANIETMFDEKPAAMEKEKKTQIKTAVIAGVMAAIVISFAVAAGAMYFDKVLPANGNESESYDASQQEKDTAPSKNGGIFDSIGDILGNLGGSNDDEDDNSPADDGNYGGGNSQSGNNSGNGGHWGNGGGNNNPSPEVPGTNPPSSGNNETEPTKDNSEDTKPSDKPSEPEGGETPSEKPTEPTAPPTEAPTEPPTEPPTQKPTEPPTEAPTETPTEPSEEPPAPDLQ